MASKSLIPVPQRLYFVDCEILQRTCSSRFRADEIASHWECMFHRNVKIYVYERNVENESCRNEKV